MSDFLKGIWRKHFDSLDRLHQGKFSEKIRCIRSDCYRLFKGIHKTDLYDAFMDEMEEMDNFIMDIGGWINPPFYTDYSSDEYLIHFRNTTFCLMSCKKSHFLDLDRNYFLVII